MFYDGSNINLQQGDNQQEYMKKFLPDNNKVQWGVTAMLVVLGSFCLYFVMFRTSTLINGFQNLMSSLMAILFGILIAYLATPVLNFIERYLLTPIYQKFGIEPTENPAKKRQMRKIAVTLTLGFVIFILYAVIALIVPQLIDSIITIVHNIPTYSNNVNRFVQQNIHNNDQVSSTIQEAVNAISITIQNFFTQNLQPQIGTIVTQISLSIYQLGASIFNFIVGLIVSVYLLYSKEYFCTIGKKFAYALFDERLANEIVGQCRYIHRMFNGFFTGKILDSAIIGVLCYIVVMIMRMPFPVLLAFIVGLTNIIPFFGPIIGAVIGSILVFMINPLQMLYFLLFAIILQQFDGNILGPKILGDSTGLSSFWVIFAIMFFGAIWGLTGWIVGVPLFAVIYNLIRRAIHHSLNVKNISPDSVVFDDLAYVENGEVKKLSDPASTKFYSEKPGSAWAKLLRIKTKGKNSDSSDNTKD